MKELQKTDPDAVESVIQAILHDAPTLAELDPAALEKLAKHVIYDDLKSNLSRKLKLARIDYAGIRADFLEQTRKKSAHSARAYGKALEVLEAFAEGQGLHVMELRPRDVDLFIQSLPGTPSTIRARITGASSFFTFLMRATDGVISNPFTGTKARPKPESRTPVVPSAEDIEEISARLKPVYRAAVVLMREHGFRVGALPTLTLWGARYTGRSKGKPIDGVLNAKSLEALKAASLDKREPFKSLKDDAIRYAFRYAARLAKEAGEISDAYSVHDIRHAFAIAEYRKDRDIYRLKTALGHDNVGITETYLKGLRAYLEMPA